MSKQISPLSKTKEETAEYSNKARKDKKSTPCRVKKRQWGHCGICGSEDITKQGVCFCNVCGMEKEFIDELDDLFSLNRPKLECSHPEYKKKWGLKSSKLVVKCLTCGAVKGPICPSCGNACWVKDSQKFCPQCRYQQY